MNRYIILLSLALSISLSMTARTPDFYTQESNLSHGTVVKIQVEQTGIYAISYEQIQRLGLRPDSIRVLGYGGNLLTQDFTQKYLDDVPSVAFYMHKGEDGQFNKGDYILFYGQGPTGWNYTGSYMARTRNCYSNYGYYFLSDEAGEQRLITDAEAIEADNYEDIDTYEAYQLHEKDLLNLVDPSGKEGGGREFYGETMTSVNHKLTIPFHFANVDTAQMAQCRILLAATSAEFSTFNISISGQQRVAMTAGIDVADFYTKATSTSVRMTTIGLTGNDMNVQIDFSPGEQTAKGYLNYIECMAHCRLMMTQAPLFFLNTHRYGTSVISRYRVQGADAGTQIWDITNPENITRVQGTFSHDTLSFLSKNDSIRRYVALRPAKNTGYLEPTIVGTVANQNLHALHNIDYVIVTPSDFYDDAVRLAQAHEDKDAITWAVVTDEQVYNEFSSGTPDASAIRWFMKMLYDRAGDNPVLRPKNLLLMGIGTFDNRKLLHNSGNNTLLTYQAENSLVETKAYATDDYFAFMQDNSGMSGNNFADTRGRMSFGVGRLPVANKQQATNAVNKAIAYMHKLSHGDWKQQLCFLADDGDHGLHVNVSDEAAEPTRVKNPGFIVNKIYLDSYVQESSASGESYPLAYNQFSNFMQKGMLFMDYSGHGSANNICSEGFLTIADVQNLSNANQAFWVLATCNFSHFDQANPCSAAEAVINPIGGAIGVFSADRTVYASNNKTLNKNLCDTLFGRTTPFQYNMTLGQACAAAKNMTGNDENKMPYILLGDPAIRLAYPTQYQVITTSETDTLNALDIVTIHGYIQSEETNPGTNDTATWFNGRMTISVFDKIQRVTTRDNDETNEQKKQFFTYNDYPNCLFKGEALVENGHFTAEFMLPKDIRYQYGNGRIVYYAVDTITGEEGIGHDERFVIGGSSSVEITDTVGPELTIYLNDPLFQNGGKTNETPHFYADIYDENGINTVGSGIGHDLMLVLDNDPNTSYVLNDYFTATLGNFRQGKASYRMAPLKEGMHTISFRAWDLINNSSSATLRFEVIKGLDVQLFQVMAYPNPIHAHDVLHFIIHHDKPDDWLHTCLRIYNISGQLVRLYETDSDDINIPMSQLGLSAGIYIYQLNIQTSTTDYTTHSSRLIVL